MDPMGCIMMYSDSSRDLQVTALEVENARRRSTGSVSEGTIDFNLQWMNVGEHDSI